MRGLVSIAFVSIAAMSLPAIAQDTPAQEAPGQVPAETTVTVDRGLTDELPYTLVYPEMLQAVDDGSEVTIKTLQYPDAPFQCDAMIQPGGAANWDARSAIASLDKAGTEQGWTTDFPGFTITTLGLTQFQSGPALLFEGASTNSPLGVPAHVFHAEAVDAGRTYVFECVMSSEIAEQARPMVNFLFANFSTRSDGACCIDPAAPPAQ